ncbi:mycofactocin-coupled SDR family oxidoreductase [Nocardia vinacea]|uniref:mycofactocin-coupled SDR family oxidoreductase n=1 Tax=Nocardia vinacea TaxID=96468 RepID=UPI0002E4DE72|nr:mycofactocin-coupled SDR family oxidoreductase [Nocardia vinacea]
MGKLSGKVALITGGARGQGRAHALALAAEGAQIVVTDLAAQLETVEYPMSTPEDLSETVRLVEKLGQRCLGISADARDLAAMQNAVAEAVSEFGRLDIAIINHGIGVVGSWNASEQAMVDVLDTNLKGVLFTASAVVPQLIKQGDGGAIVMTSSVTALRPVNDFGVYAAAKSGVLGLMRSLSADLAPYRIRVNAICPGTVNTPMATSEVMLSKMCGVESGGTVEGADFAFRSLNLLPELWLEPHDIANAALFLVTDDSRFITGITMPVDLGNVNQPFGVPLIATEVLAAAQLR